MSSSAAVARTSQTSEAAIFSRVWEAEQNPLSATLARHVLKLRFSTADQDRMHELAAKNQASELTPPEADELDNFLRVGDLVELLQSKARRRLNKSRPGAACDG